MMKKRSLLLILLAFVWAEMQAQNMVHVSEIEERNVDGKKIIYAGEKKLNGVVYEDYVSKKMRYSVKNGIKAAQVRLTI